MAEENSVDVADESIPPPPPWAGERALERMVSAALRVPRGVPIVRAPADEIVIDLDDLDVDPRLVSLLRRHFADDQGAIDRALARYCGRYATLADYAVQVLEGEDLPEWLWPYVDVDAIARDWVESGALWILDDDRRAGGVHVFSA